MKFKLLEYKINNISAAIKPLCIFAHIFPIFPFNMNKKDFSLKLNFFIFLWHISINTCILWCVVIKTIFFPQTCEWNVKYSMNYSSFDDFISNIYFFYELLNLIISSQFFIIFRKKFNGLLIELHEINTKMEQLNMKNTNQEMFNCSLIYVIIFSIYQTVTIIYDIYDFTLLISMKISFLFLISFLLILFSFCFVILYDIKIKFQRINKTIHKIISMNKSNEIYVQQILHFYLSLCVYCKHCNNLFNIVFFLIVGPDFCSLITTCYFLFEHIVLKMDNFNFDYLFRILLLNFDIVIKVLLLNFICNVIYTEVFDFLLVF